MGRIVKRFFILPNAARSHDLIDIRLMKPGPGLPIPLASRRRRNTPASPAPSSPAPAPTNSHTPTGPTPVANAQDNQSNTGTVEPPAPITPPKTRTRPAPTQKPNTDKPKAWHVVLLDSNDHTYEYVIEMMMNVFRHPIERAFHIARQVDEHGRAVCATTHRELGELRVEQVRGFGADPRIASSRAAMRCYLEPAE